MIRRLFAATVLSAFALCAQAAPQISAPGQSGQTPLSASSVKGGAALPTLIGRSAAWPPQFGVDTKRNKLLLAAEDHGTVEVFDLDTGAYERTLTTFDTPHAVQYLPRQNRLVITDSGKGGTRILDAATYKVVGHIDLDSGADSMAYGKVTLRLYILTGGKDAGMTSCLLNEGDPSTGKVERKLRFYADHVEAGGA